MATYDLATLLPALLPQEDALPTVEVLKSFGIFTAVDLVFTPSIPPHPALPPAAFSRLKSVVSAHLGAPSTSGAYLLRHHHEQIGKQPQRFSSSLDELDQTLLGGFELGEVVEICGVRSSGRTALALYTVLLHLLLHSDKRAAWLDTGGTFDPFRCLAILRDVLIPRLYQLGGSFASDGEEEPGAEKLAISVLDRLAVSRTSSAGAALDTLAAETRTDGKAETLDMVVVDSLDALLGGEALSGSSARGPASLVGFLRRLSSLAQSSTLPLVILVISLLPRPPHTTGQTADVIVLPLAQVSTTVSPTTTTPPASKRSAAPSFSNLPAQPPPLSSLPLASPLKPSLGSTYTYQLDVSLLVLPAEPLFGPRDGKDRYLLEVTRNPRGKTGMLVAFKLENGVKLEQLEE
ncbi:hypothetical protein JCM11251_007092 [Rhodosporidiobolus azoricus]